MFKKIFSAILAALYLSSSSTGCGAFNMTYKGIEKSYGNMLYNEYQDEKTEEQLKRQLKNTEEQKENGEQEEGGTENIEEENINSEGDGNTEGQ